MSFSSEVKGELLNQKIDNDCCGFAFLAGVINTIGSLEISHGGFSFSLRTDNLSIIEKVQEVINILYADKVDLYNHRIQNLFVATKIPLAKMINQIYHHF